MTGGSDVLSGILNALLLKYYKAEVGSNFRCVGKLIIQGHGKYTIGNNVHINSKETVNPIGGNHTVLQTLNGGSIAIGNNVGMSHAILCARKSIVIEDDVMLGAGVKIYDTDFHSIAYEERVHNGDKKVNSKEVRIREGAFIGAHSIILKGVTVGRHSVIGAGSVVTKEVPDGEIWAGNPAKKIGTVPQK